MTALADALLASGHVPERPDRFVDPQLSIRFWMHGCPHPGCTTWVPHHRRCCARHEEKT